MEIGKHFNEQVALGNPNQPNGRHREGVGFIPVGDRDRAKYDYGIDFTVERDSDPNIRRI